MWQRIYGIGNATILKAKKLLRHSAKYYERAYTPQTDVSDLVSTLLMRKFVEECETVADGLWHLQDVENIKKSRGTSPRTGPGLVAPFWWASAAKVINPQAQSLYAGCGGKTSSS